MHILALFFVTFVFKKVRLIEADAFLKPFSINVRHLQFDNTKNYIPK